VSQASYAKRTQAAQNNLTSRRTYVLTCTITVQDPITKRSSHVHHITVRFMYDPHARSFQNLYTYSHTTASLARCMHERCSRTLTPAMLREFTGPWKCVAVSPLSRPGKRDAPLEHARLGSVGELRYHNTCAQHTNGPAVTNHSHEYSSTRYLSNSRSFSNMIDKLR